MGEGQLVGVEAQPSDGIGARSVLFVTCHRTAQFLHVYPDLIFSSSVNGDVQQRLAVSGFDHLVVGNGLLGVGAGSTGEAEVGGSFHQVGADAVPVRVRNALHHGQISPPGDHMVPVVLEQRFSIRVLGEEKDTGGVPIQPVDHIDAVVHMLALHIVGDQAVGGAGAFLFVGHRQQLGWFVHRNELVVLVEDGKGQRTPPSGRRGGQQGHLLSGRERSVKLGCGPSIHGHQAAGQEGLYIIAAFSLHIGQ